MLGVRQIRYRSVNLLIHEGFFICLNGEKMWNTNNEHLLSLRIGMHKFECNSLENGVTRKHINRAIIHRIEKMTNFTRLCSRRIFSQFAHRLPLSPCILIQTMPHTHIHGHIHMLHKYQWIMSYILICRSSPIIRHHLIHTSVLESTFCRHQQYAHNLCKFHSLAHMLVTDWDLLYCAIRCSVGYSVPFGMVLR